jgi:hypothetical protein
VNEVDRIAALVEVAVLAVLAVRADPDPASCRAVPLDDADQIRPP